jgi:hypothetical protein
MISTRDASVGSTAGVAGEDPGAHQPTGLRPPARPTGLLGRDRLGAEATRAVAWTLVERPHAPPKTPMRSKRPAGPRPQEAGQRGKAGGHDSPARPGHLSPRINPCCPAPTGPATRGGGAVGPRLAGEHLNKHLTPPNDTGPNPALRNHTPPHRNLSAFFWQAQGFPMNP